MTKKTSGWSGLLSLLKKKNFRLLWMGQLFSQGGDRFIQLLLVAWVATRMPGSTWSLAKVFAATALPALLFNPFAGAYVDRWDRKKTMITCDIIRVCVVLAFPWLASSDSPVALYSGVFVLFALSAFFIPARLAMIPDVVPPDRLAKANALFANSGMIGSAVVILIGAHLVEWLGISKAAWINAFFYAASAVCILPIVGGSGHRKESSENPRIVFHEIWEGILAMWKHPPTHRLMILIGLLMAGGGATAVVGTILVQEALGTVTKDLGFISIWFGSGVFLGTVAYGRWESDLPRGIALGLTFLGTGLALLGFIGAIMILKSGAYASLSSWMLGFWSAPVMIIANTMVHERHPERLHGRIFSSFGVVTNVALIIATLTAGWLVEGGGRGVFLSMIAGFFILAGVVLFFRARRRESRTPPPAS